MAGVPTNVEPIQLKALLRSVLGETVADNIIGAREQGFSDPDSGRPRNSIKAFVEDKLVQAVYSDRMESSSVTTDALGWAASASLHRLLTWSALNFQILCRGS